MSVRRIVTRGGSEGVEERTAQVIFVVGGNVVERECRMAVPSSPAPRMRMLDVDILV